VILQPVCPWLKLRRGTLVTVTPSDHERAFILRDFSLCHVRAIGSTREPFTIFGVGLRVVLEQHLGEG
jgi:hypothetical protein